MRLSWVIFRLFLWAQIILSTVTAQNTTTTTSGNATTSNYTEPDPVWSGCVMEGTDADTKVMIGKTTIICIHIGNGTDWNGGISYIRLAFEPTADQYSRLYVPNCKLLLKS